MQEESIDPPLRPGTRFQPIEVLGRGTAGVVYRVHDRETDSEVALKTFSARSPEDLFRLKSEFRVLADLAHYNLVELYELIVDDDQPCFTMEYVDGRDFVAWLRQDPATTLARLPSCAAQLVDGIASLHAAGKLHRDIKPSNVLVTREGRVVLLDFSLTIAFGRNVPRHKERGLSGTFAYMAPEVFTGAEPSPETDWYSVGVLLHEALTGELPFDALSDPRASAATTQAIPLRWNEVLGRLLDNRPERRHEGVDLLRQVAGAPRRRPSRVDGVFVGRRSELELLDHALAAASAGEGRVVHVVGSSGIGKSELLRHFLHRADASSQADDSREQVVLAGRCHPQEAVPYKAFDSAIDQLSRVLVSDPELAAACVPEEAGALRRLFPVLERVPVVAAAPAPSRAIEPVEIRRVGFAALRTLLTRLAERTVAVLWIDDLQWSDPDSLLLLREILRAPTPALLVVLSYRSEDASSAPLQHAAMGLDAPELRIDLEPFDAADGAAMMRSLGVDAEVAQRDLSQIVAEANGNPFFLGELARSLVEGRTAPRILDLVGDRLGELNESSRLLLEMVSVAGGPLPRSIALTATGVGERGRPLAGGLEKRSLLRTTILGSDVGLEIYHDRIRESVLAMLPPDKLEQRHGTLADVLAVQPDPDAEALYRHSLGAGRRHDAGHWAEQAADRASTSLAFERAAELFGEARALQPDGASTWQLVEKLASALANSGRALEAATTYQDASRQLAIDDGTRTRDLVRLRERAATHYLQTGHLDEGLAMTREVLGEVGVPFPRSQMSALWSSVLHRARLGRRGLDYELQPSPLDEGRQLRLDACWGAAISMTMVDPASSDALGSRHLLEALDSGDAAQTILAIGGEAARVAQISGSYFRRRSVRLADMMETLVKQHGGPFEHAHVHSVRGMIAFQAAHWRRAHEHFAASSEILRRDCYGKNWELVTIETFGLSALAHGGELARMAELLPRSIGNAADRGDLYASLLFHTGVMNLAWLARDEGDEALAVAEETMRRWPASQTFQVQHYVHLIAATNADLYRGDPWSAFHRIERAWPKLRAALFLAFESARVELRNLRARAALAAAVSSEGPADARWPRERLLKLASRDAAQLARIESVVSARPLAVLIDAGVQAARGQTEAAARGYAQAAQGLAAVDMSMHAAAAAQRLAQRQGAAQPCEESRIWAEKEAVRRPERMFAVFAPAPDSSR